MHYRVSGHRIAVSLSPSQDGRSGVGGLGVPISGSSAARGRGGVHGGHIGHAFFGCGAFRHRRVLIMTSIVFSKFQLYKVLFGSPLWREKFIIFCLNFYKQQAKIPNFKRLSTRQTRFTYCNLNMFKNSNFSCAFLARVGGHFSYNYHF